MRPEAMPVRPLAEVAENEGVLRYLANGGAPASVSVEWPTEATDTWRLGAHPDIVERLWTTLNDPLPRDARVLLANGAALVHRRSGLVVAVALGTQYAIRLVDEDFAAALARGYATSHEFRTVGRSLDLEATLGRGWVIGRRDPDEAEWLVRSYAAANL